MVKLLMEEMRESRSAFADYPRYNWTGKFTFRNNGEDSTFIGQSLIYIIIILSEIQLSRQAGSGTPKYLLACRIITIISPHLVYELAKAFPVFFYVDMKMKTVFNFYAI